MEIDVIFETEDAIFHFELSDAVDQLRYYSNEHKVNEATEILEAISRTSSEEIKIASDYFGYIVLDLLHQRKGSVYCKPCQRTYESSQLTSIPLGFGSTPFNVKLKGKGGIIKRLFGRKQLICGSGGEKYLCPHGHELISAITWTGILRIPKQKTFPTS